MSRRPIDGDALAAYLEHFRKRVLQDALAEATAAYWIWRAETLEAARPGGYVYPGTIRKHKATCRQSCDKCPVLHREGERKVDWPGAATAEELTEQVRRLTVTAMACRQRAAVSLIGGQAA